MEGTMYAKWKFWNGNRKRELIMRCYISAVGYLVKRAITNVFILFERIFGKFIGKFQFLPRSNRHPNARYRFFCSSNSLKLIQFAIIVWENSFGKTKNTVLLIIAGKLCKCWKSTANLYFWLHEILFSFVVRWMLVDGTNSFKVL